MWPNNIFDRHLSEKHRMKNGKTEICVECSAHHNTDLYVCEDLLISPSLFRFSQGFVGRSFLSRFPENVTYAKIPKVESWRDLVPTGAKFSRTDRANKKYIFSSGTPCT